MARLTGRHLWLSVLATALFAPVFLASSHGLLRPAWLLNRFAGLPVSVWIILGLIVLFVAMVVRLARAMTAEGEDETP